MIGNPLNLSFSHAASWRRAGRTALMLFVLCAAPPLIANAAAQTAQPVTAPDPAGWDLVFGASRYAQEARDAPASVTIVSAREIREFGYRTLADVLGAVRGFTTRNDLNYEYATVRGLSRLGDFNTRILVMLDGQRLNGFASDVSYIGTDALIDLDRVLRIEIIRGPGSALFGTNAFSGVINIITDRRVGAKGGARVEAEAGSFGTSRVSASWSTSVGAPREFMIGTSAQRRMGRDRFDSDFNTPDQNNGVAQGLDGDESARLVTRGRTGPWTFHGAMSRRLRSVPTAPYGTEFNVKPMRTIDQQMVGSLAYSRTFDDLSRLGVALGGSRVRYDGTYPYEGFQLTDLDVGNQFTLEAQYVRVVGPGHKLAFGSEARLGTHGQIGVSESGTTPRSDAVDLPEFSQRVGALYAQAEWRLGDRALLYTGVRHDQYEVVGGTTNPRLALVVRASEHTTLKALYGEAFRAPNLYERFYEDDGESQKAPVSLSPETVRSMEFEVERRLGGLIGTVSAYRLSTASLINLTTDSVDNLLLYKNEGAPRAQGIEFEVRGRVGPATGRASYAAQDAVDELGDHLADSPRHMARVGLSLPLLRSRSNVAAEIRHVGARATIAGTEVPAYTLTHLTCLVRSRGQRAELLLSVKDIFNAGHADPAGAEHRQSSLAQDGRSVRTGLRFTF